MCLLLPVAFTVTLRIFFSFFPPCAYLHRHNHCIVKVVFLCPPLCRCICETLLLLEPVVPLRFANFEAVVLLFPFASPLHPLVALCVLWRTQPMFCSLYRSFNHAGFMYLLFPRVIFVLAVNGQFFRCRCFLFSF